MIRHYLSSAFANLLRAPITAAAGILTLALGLLCFVAAYGIATYWRSGDLHHKSSDRTFFVGQSLTLVGQEKPGDLRARSTATLAKYLREDFSEIDEIARAYAEEKVPVAFDGAKVLLDGAFVDPSFLKIFDMEFVAGDPQRALDAPNSIVLTQESAQRLFGSGPALGKSVLLDGKTETIVTGVIAEPRQPSFMGSSADSVLRFGMLGNWSAHSGGAFRDASEFWLGTSGYTFVTLKQAALRDAMTRALPAFVERRMPAEARAVARMGLDIKPVSELTVRSLDARLLGRNEAGLGVVPALLGLGLIALAIACVNFANLAAAQAAVRAREIGMRAVVGARRMDIMLQSFFESFLLALTAFAVAVALLAALAPVIRIATDVDLLYFVKGGLEPLAFLASLLVGVALAAGAYPALVLSRVKPAHALRSGRSRSGPKSVLQALVGVQFAAASFLLILLTVAQLQRSEFENKSLAKRADPIIVLNDLQPLGVDLSALADQLRQRPGVVSVTGVGTPPWSDYAAILSLARSADPGVSSVRGYSTAVAHDYFSTLDVGLLAGRAFDRAHEPDSASDTPAPSAPLPVVIDEEMSIRLGFESPSQAVDRILYAPRAGQPPRPVQVIGVAETDTMRVGGTPGQMFFHLSRPFIETGHGPYPIVRVSRDRVSDARNAIVDVWDRFAPNAPADIRFFDELFEESYRQHARVGQLFATLAASAFAISTTGLLGIAIHTASRRRREIAIRKTLGSTVAGVAKLLLTDFSIPVLIGNLLAWPLAYLAAQAYLSAFAQRIELSPAPFLLSMAITLAIAWAAIIGVVLKAASLRPAEVLRHA
jgi:putative ABC transport system permease protein